MFESFACPECGRELEDIEQIGGNDYRGYCSNCLEEYEVEGSTEEEDLLQLEVGKTYQNNFGALVKIVSKKNRDVFICDDDNEYGLFGSAIYKGRNWNLFMEVE